MWISWLDSPPSSLCGWEQEGGRRRKRGRKWATKSSAAASVSFVDALHHHHSKHTTKFCLSCCHWYQSLVRCSLKRTPHSLAIILGTIVQLSKKCLEEKVFLPSSFHADKVSLLIIVLASFSKRGGGRSSTFQGKNLQIFPFSDQNRERGGWWWFFSSLLPVCLLSLADFLLGRTVCQPGSHQ